MHFVMEDCYKEPFPILRKWYQQMSLLLQVHAARELGCQIHRPHVRSRFFGRGSSEGPYSKKPKSSCKILITVIVRRLIFYLLGCQICDSNHNFFFNLLIFSKSCAVKLSRIRLLRLVLSPKALYLLINCFIIEFKDNINKMIFLFN